MVKSTRFHILLLATIPVMVLFSVVGCSRTLELFEETGSGSLMLEIETLPQKDEMPGVVFQHDLHTIAMEGECTRCHKEDAGSIVFKFQRIQEPSTMTLYHDGCVACHKEQKTAGNSFGPLAAQCRSCHVPGQSIDVGEKKIVFSRSLHHIHIKAPQIKGIEPDQEENCSRCHHQYNKKTEKFSFKKGQEAACQYCHKAVSADDTRSIQQASHDSCVSCHYTFTRHDQTAGPVECAGCHSSELQDSRAVLSRIPRLLRGQPDVTVIGNMEMIRSIKTGFMDAVAFNHKSHEAELDSCKICHHKKLEKCSSCHLLDGKGSTGGSISLEQAMHEPNSTHSCMGCHQKQKQKEACAGCHFMIPGRANEKGHIEECNICHNTSSKLFKQMPLENVAERILNDTMTRYGHVEEDQIPDTVVIDELSENYDPALFPHRRIIQTLMEQTLSNGLAKTFHGDDLKICKGCHHHQPGDATPAKCVSCHSRKGPGPEDRPGLKGAFHIQCMTCHREMNIKTIPATDCTACHDKKVE